MRINFDPKKIFFHPFNFRNPLNRNSVFNLSDFFQEAFLPPDIYCRLMWEQQLSLNKKTKEIFLSDCAKECTVFKKYLGLVEND